MKIPAIIAWTILSLTIVSSTVPKSNLPNDNSWSIGIGKEPLLASWLDNEMGDTLSLLKQQLKSTDTLFAHRYLCGQTSDGDLTVLAIKNSYGEIIAESITESNSLVFEANLSVKELLLSSRIKSGEVLDVYFSIKEYSDKEDYTVLLCSLKLD